MKPIKKAIWQLLNKIELGGAVQLMLESALLDYGWFRSYHTKQSIDKQGNPIPWCTYAFIQFIEPRLHQQMDVFEFGSGNSTRWYAERVRSITSVEHDEAWMQQVKPQLPANAQVVFKPLDETYQYAHEVSRAGKKYHIIIIDGRQRNKSAEYAADYLTDDGILVWDNSEREQYQATIRQLLQKGFKRIDFWGVLPVVSNMDCTTIFYRTNNCLDI